MVAEPWGSTNQTFGVPQRNTHELYIGLREGKDHERRVDRAPAGGAPVLNGPDGVVRNCRRLFCWFSSRLRESTAALRSRLPPAVPRPFRTIREVRTAATAVVLNLAQLSSNSSSGGLISGVATVSSRCATRAVLPRSASDSEPCAKSRCVGAPLLVVATPQRSGKLTDEPLFRSLPDVWPRRNRMLRRNLSTCPPHGSSSPAVGCRSTRVR